MLNDTRALKSDLLKLINDAQICYAVLHDAGAASDGSGDLDIVVSRKDFDRLVSLMNERYDIVQAIKNNELGYGFIISAPGANGPVFAVIDIYTSIFYEGPIRFKEEDFLRDRKLRDGIWVTAPEAEFGYLLIKRLYKGSFKLSQRANIEAIFGELGRGAGNILNGMLGEKWGPKVGAWISDKRWDLIEANARNIRDAVSVRGLVRDPLGPVRFASLQAQRILERIRRPSGLFVAVLGPDGSGKTAIACGIEERLKILFRRSKIFHFRPEFLWKTRAYGIVTDPHKDSPHPQILSIFKAICLLLDYNLGYIFRVYPRLLSSGLVIFDRYYIDMVADPLRLRYGGPAWLTKFIDRLIPKPDLILVLDVPEAQLLTRKRELPEVELKRQRSYYREYARMCDNVLILDGSLSLDAAANCATDAALAYMRGRSLGRHKKFDKIQYVQTMGWITSVLSSDGQKARFAPSRVCAALYSEWKCCDRFIWLDLKDGRGYIIPEAPRQAAVAGSDIYNPQRLMAKAAKRALKALIKIGAASTFFPQVRLLMRKDISVDEMENILLTEHIKKVVARGDLKFAISAGTPGLHRKPTIKIMTDEGKVLGYAKVGHNEAIAAFVRNEAETLRKLDPRSFKAPRLLYEGQWQGRYLTIQSPPEGNARDLPASMSARCDSILKELGSINSKELRYEESAFWKRITARAGGITNSYYKRLTALAVNKVKELIGDRSIRFSFSHGDFASWNMKLIGNDIFLFDWESACLETPVGMDAIHFFVQAAQRIEKRPPHEVCNTYYDKGLFLMYALDKFAFYACEESSNNENIDFFGALVSNIIYG